MMLNATFNNISVISWRSVLLVAETGGPGENQRLVASYIWFKVKEILLKVALNTIKQTKTYNTCISFSLQKKGLVMADYLDNMSQTEYYHIQMSNHKNK
jgi:hypothetical protein